MKCSYLSIATLFLSATMLAACQGASDGAHTDNSNQAKADTGPRIPVSESLLVVPENAPSCDPAKPIVATVSWKVSSAQASAVMIEVQDPKAKGRKVLTRAPRVGTVETGEWVMPGTTFYLSPDGSAPGSELAMRVVGSEACTN